MFGDTEAEKRRREEDKRRREDERRKRDREERQLKKRRIKEQERKEKRTKELERRREVSKKFIDKMQNNLLGGETPDYMQPHEIQEPEVRGLCRAGFGFTAQNAATKKPQALRPGPAMTADPNEQHGSIRSGPSNAGGGGVPARLKRPI